ncbi:hypothetical protein LB452_05730 [Psychroflexus sp. CAK8W]|uniref:Outer membrane protein beta-barrel domain-containing protein n=1 Tax=Psychroflexus longus TaxID=2873596 RepID=A0ABS7XI63_9FLAO|nr:hypothetical protein [Psychroflexus longus]MBZ9778420.1 hypothetical protein [Psychroflexus longus]
MKNIFLVLTLALALSAHSQNPLDLLNAGNAIAKSTDPVPLEKRWFSHVDIDFAVANSTEYNYKSRDENGKIIYGSQEELTNKVAYGILYSYSYPIFKKFTLGAVGGIQHQVQQSITALKAGTVMKYHFVDYESVNLNFMLAGNIALDEKIDSNFANLRLGLQFPITTVDGFVVNLNVFGDFNDFIFNESILEGVNDDPMSIVYRSYGFSLGIQF